MVNKGLGSSGFLVNGGGLSTQKSAEHLLSGDFCIEKTRPISRSQPSKSAISDLVRGSRNRRLATGPDIRSLYKYSRILLRAALFIPGTASKSSSFAALILA